MITLPFSSNRSLSSCCLPLVGLISSVISDLGSKIFSSLCRKSCLFPNHLSLHLFQYDVIILRDRWPKLQGVIREKSYHSPEYLACHTEIFYLPSSSVWSYSSPQIWTKFKTISSISRYFNCLLLIAPYFLDNLYIMFRFFLITRWFGFFLQNYQINQLCFSSISIPFSSVPNFPSLYFKARNRKKKNYRSNLRFPFVILALTSEEVRKTLMW